MTDEEYRKKLGLSRRKYDLASMAGLIVSRKDQELAEYIFAYLEEEREDHDNENWLSAETIGFAIDAFKGGAR